MLFQRFAQTVVGLLVLLLLAVVVSFTTVFIQTWREYEGFQAREAARLRAVELARVDFQRKDDYFRLLISDQAFLERVVRERLGYAQPDETVFRFDRLDS